MGSKELSVVDPREQRRPEISEGGRAAHVLPAQAVDLRKRETWRRRSDQVHPRRHDPTVTAGGEADRACAIRPGRGGLKVDSRQKYSLIMRNDEVQLNGSVTLAWAKFPEQAHSDRFAGYFVA